MKGYGYRSGHFWAHELVETLQQLLLQRKVGAPVCGPALAQSPIWLFWVSCLLIEAQLEVQAPGMALRQSASTGKQDAGREGQEAAGARADPGAWGAGHTSASEVLLCDRSLLQDHHSPLFLDT